MKKKIKILVVDDEPVIRSLFTDLLEDQGYQAVTVQNGLEAVEAVQSEDFALAFMDVHMPLMNGVEALRKIRKIRPQMRIAMMDSFPNCLIEEAKKEGVLTCIHKPFEIKLVFEIIEQVEKGEDSLCAQAGS
ncbi:response regulator [Candidatus Omnitrophota bacterium]